MRVSAVPGVEPELGGPAVCPAEEGPPARQVEGVRQVSAAHLRPANVGYKNISFEFSPLLIFPRQCLCCKLSGKHI